MSDVAISVSFYFLEQVANIEFMYMGHLHT